MTWVKKTTTATKYNAEPNGKRKGIRLVLFSVLHVDSHLSIDEQVLLTHVY